MKVEHEPKSPFLLEFRAGTPKEPIFTIEADGTVVIHKPGADKEAAKMFYEALRLEGQSLIQVLEGWKARALKAEAQLQTFLSYCSVNGEVN